MVGRHPHRDVLPSLTLFCSPDHAVRLLLDVARRVFSVRRNLARRRRVERDLPGGKVGRHRGRLAAVDDDPPHVAVVAARPAYKQLAPALFNRRDHRRGGQIVKGIERVTPLSILDLAEEMIDDRYLTLVLMGRPENTFTLPAGINL